MNLNEALTKTTKSSDFSKAIGIIKSLMKDQESYVDVDKYKKANKKIADLQLSYARNANDSGKVVRAARKYLNKIATEFGVQYKYKINKQWYEAMQSLEKMGG